MAGATQYGALLGVCGGVGREGGCSCLGLMHTEMGRRNRRGHDVPEPLPDSIDFFVTGVCHVSECESGDPSLLSLTQTPRH